jgi:hypothetical protein
MEIKMAKKLMEKHIEELERVIYTFEHVLRPRYDADRQILERLRHQYIKLDALSQKMERGEEISTEEVTDAIPKELR